MREMEQLANLCLVSNCPATVEFFYFTGGGVARYGGPHVNDTFLGVRFPSACGHEAAFLAG
jgi:hypothetical protein